MNLIRMIKLFAWEPKIIEKLSKKREDELVWFRKRQILELINMNLKYAAFETSFTRSIDKLPVSSSHL